MPGVKQLRKLQWAKETTNGTAITTATAIWRGQGGMLDDQREVVFPDELIGIFDGADRSHIAKITAALDLAETEATFEQLPYLPAMLYGGPVIGVADGTGSSGFKYITFIPATSAPTNVSYTIQGGDNFEAEYMEYAKCTKLTLKGSSGDSIKVSASLIGRQVTRLSTGLTPSIAVPTVEDALFGNTKLFLDPINGVAGTTQVVNQFLGFEVTFEGMWIPKFTGDGNLFWSFAVFVTKHVTGKITFEHDTAADGNTGLKSHLRAQTPRLLSILAIGSSYATPGTGTLFGGKRALNIVLPIKWTKVPPLDDQDGNDTLTAEFVSKYNSVAGSAGSITITNEVSTLP